MVPGLHRITRYTLTIAQINKPGKKPAMNIVDVDCDVAVA
jgi:hypothetical protein